MSDIHVIILGGGLGTRIKKVIGANQPKILAKVQGLAFIEYLLRWINPLKASRITIATGHLHAEIEKYIKQKNYKQICLSQEKTQLGTMGAAYLAASKANISNLLIMNGDTLVNFDLMDLVNRPMNGLTTVVVKEYKKRLHGSVKYGFNDEKDGTIGYSEEEAPKYISTGIILIKKETLTEIHKTYGSEEGTITMIDKDLLGNLRLEKYVLDNNVEMIDIGTPSSYKLIQELPINL